MDLRAIISNARKTRKIDLSYQNLHEIPEELYKLKNLEELNLSNNKIRIVPSQIQNLVSLKKLDLSCNQISKISRHVGSLEHLTELNLSNNSLKTIPGDLYRLPWSQGMINVSNNPLNIPTSVLERGNKAVVQYLSTKSQEESEARRAKEETKEQEREQEIAERIQQKAELKQQRRSKERDTAFQKVKGRQIKAQRLVEVEY